MADGNHLAHPALETGERKRMKILPIEPSEDIPNETLREVLTLGIAFIRDKHSH